MTKPAKPGSLREYVEKRIESVRDYEDLNKVLVNGTRADYLLFDRNVVVEQKEFENSPQQREKGLRLQNYCTTIFYKYRINPEMPDTSKYSLLSNDEKDHLHILRDRFYNKIKIAISEANPQIEATKRRLSLPNARGVVLMIFDQVAGIMPYVVSERVIRTFDSKKSGSPLYNQVDAFVYVIRMKDMLYNGSSFVKGHIVRDNSTEVAKYTSEIIHTLKKDISRERSLKPTSESDIIQQLVPNLFDV